MDSDRRRTFLRLAGSATLACFAGCAGDQTGGDGTGDGGTNTGGASEDVTTDESRATADSKAENGETESATIGRTDGPETADGTGDGQTATADTTNLGGPVPNAYRTATSLGGTERNPDSLQSKRAVQYQPTPKDGQRCADCMFYIPDKDGDELGACGIVEGLIQPAAWCVSFSPQNG